MEPRGVVGREVVGRSAVRRSNSARISFSDLVAVVPVDVGVVMVVVGEAMSAKRSSRTSVGLDIVGCAWGDWRTGGEEGRGGGEEEWVG